MGSKIIITGAGSAQSNGVINCLLMAGDGEEIVGLGSNAADLMLCRAHKKYLMPHSGEPNYEAALLNILAKEKPQMIHFQHDAELAVAMRFRDKIEGTGVRMLVPDNETIDTCVHKHKSWQKFKAAGMVVPQNILLNEPDDVRRAMNELGGATGTVWLRSTTIGGGGKGALPTNDAQEAIEWISRHKGWGSFAAAELLTEQTVTWLSIWQDGELIVAQTRRRKGWLHSALSLSGVTGVTKIGETYSDAKVDAVAMQAVQAASAKPPHGVYGVDMAYDQNGIPNPTEINIARFFTTVQFFAEAGLNMPKILKDIVLYDRRPKLANKINPLPNGLLWLRGMDCVPMLTTAEKMEHELITSIL